MAVSGFGLRHGQNRDTTFDTARRTSEGFSRSVWKGIKINEMLHLPEENRWRTGKGLANL
jgi:hypothetical protein